MLFLLSVWSNADIITKGRSPKKENFPFYIRKYSETEDFFHSRMRLGSGFSNFSYYFVTFPNTVIVIL